MSEATVKDLLQVHLPRQIELCIKEPIHLLPQTMERFLSGTAKNEMASWYLTLIENEVEQFLAGI